MPRIRLATALATNEVKLWDAEVGKEKATLRGHENPVRCVAFSADGKYLATGSEDHTVRLWEVSSGKALATIEAPRPGHVRGLLP